MGLFDKINSLINNLDESLTGSPLPSPPSRQERVNDSVDVIKSHSISCHCGGLAVPLKFRGKIYKCVRCDRQFANTRYELSGLKKASVNGVFLTKRLEKEWEEQNNIMTFYDDAVALIKKEDQLKTRS